MIINPVRKEGTRFRYQFVHNVYAHFFKNLLEYMSDYLYPRFEYTIVSPYHKAVEYINKQKELGHEVDQPTLPALILDPSGDFGVSDYGGKQLYRYPNLMPGFIKHVYEPIYRDQNVIITPGFIRIKGEINLSILTDSFYEYCDIRMYLLQIFGGTDRYIYPQYFKSFIILPDELYNYQYVNDETNLVYKLDWEKAGAKEVLVKTINQNKYTYECLLKPVIKLTNLSDGSEKYGGTENLATWRLTATLEYDIEIPHYLILESDYLATTISCNIEYGSQYSKYNTFVPVVKDNILYVRDTSLDETSSSEVVIVDDASSAVSQTETIYTKKITYLYRIQRNDFDVVGDLDIELNETILDYRLLVVVSKFGILQYGDDYILKNSGNTLSLLDFKNHFAKLQPDDFIEIHVYKESK